MKDGFPIPQDKIRIAIKEMETIQELQSLVSMCFVSHTQNEDRRFILECLSEIEYRNKGGDHHGTSKET